MPPFVDVPPQLLLPAKPAIILPAGRELLRPTMRDRVCLGMLPGITPIIAGGAAALSGALAVADTATDSTVGLVGNTLTRTTALGDAGAKYICVCILVQDADHTPGGGSGDASATLDTFTLGGLSPVWSTSHWLNDEDEDAGDEEWFDGMAAMGLFGPFDAETSASLVFVVGAHTHSMDKYSLAAFRLQGLVDPATPTAADTGTSAAGLSHATANPGVSIGMGATGRAETTTTCNENWSGTGVTSVVGTAAVPAGEFCAAYKTDATTVTWDHPDINSPANRWIITSWEWNP